MISKRFLNGLDVTKEMGLIFLKPNGCEHPFKLFEEFMKILSKQLISKYSYLSVCPFRMINCTYSLSLYSPLSVFPCFRSYPGRWSIIRGS